MCQETLKFYCHFAIHPHQSLLYVLVELGRPYNYEGSYHVCIPRIGVRDVTIYKGSVPALAMVGSKLVTVA